MSLKAFKHQKDKHPFLANKLINEYKPPLLV